MRVRARSGANPVDAGFGLVHADTIIATTDDVLSTPSLDAGFRLTVGRRNTRGPVADLGLGPGCYQALLAIGAERAAPTEKPVPLILLAPDRVVRRFGARGVSLEYDRPVIVGRAPWGGDVRKVSWPSLWKTGACPDIVVDFAADYKLIFWRGAGYVPAWAAGNVLTTNFFVETVEPGVYRDCCEPMSDRECRYSHVRLLYSSPARAVIHWRYALTDSAYTICRDYWVDELLYVYPDGVAVRNATLVLDPQDDAVWRGDPPSGRRLPCSMINGPPGKRTFNDTEFMTVNPAGARPEDHTPAEALTILDTDRFALDCCWPQPPDLAKTPPPRLDAYIFRMNYRHRPGTFLASHPEGMRISLQPNTGLRYCAGASVRDDSWETVSDLPGTFADFLHWPVTRGFGTAPVTSPAEYLDRPTHTFLGFANAEPVEVGADGAVTWRWLCGMAPEDEAALRSLVKGWVHPAVIHGAAYSPRERAYLVSPSQAGRDVRVGDRPVVAPAFVLLDTEAASLRMLVDGCPIHPTHEAVGIERGARGAQTVVTLDRPLPAGSVLRWETT